MGWLIWSGAAVTMAGVTGLAWSAFDALQARRANLDEAAMRARLQRAVTVNYAALMVAALGLMMVVAGLFLGGGRG